MCNRVGDEASVVGRDYPPACGIVDRVDKSADTCRTPDAILRLPHKAVVDYGRCIRSTRPLGGRRYRKFEVQVSTSRVDIAEFDRYCGR